MRLKKLEAQAMGEGEEAEAETVENEAAQEMKNKNVEAFMNRMRNKIGALEKTSGSGEIKVPVGNEARITSLKFKAFGMVPSDAQSVRF